jgi:hypothetical protein
VDPWPEETVEAALDALRLISSGKSRIFSLDRLTETPYFLFMIATLTSNVKPNEAWEAFGKEWVDPWPEETVEAALDVLRGRLDLPAAGSDRPEATGSRPSTPRYCS